MSNEHIFEYLTYYLELKATPEYAVMVKGAWGIGKTFAIKRFVEQHKGRGILYSACPALNRPTTLINALSLP
jgi:hypothetical protein